MRILITRPREDAESFAATLIARGLDVTIEPLLTVQPIATPAIDLDGVQAILFTSANGVRCFAAANSRRDLKVLTVGDGSATVARELGFAQVESASGDVTSLATLVTDRLHPRDGALLHAAGSSLAGDLKGQLEAAGFVVRRAVLYDAVPATELSPATLMNLRLGGIDAIALFSPRSARTFVDLWRRAAPVDGGLQKVTALCLSAAVAREVKDLDWRRSEIAARPDSDALLALVELEQQRRDVEMSNSGPAAESPREEAARDNGASTDGSTGTIDADMRAAAASDAAAGAAIVAAMPKPAGPGRGGALILGLLAGAIAGGAMVVTEPVWRPYLPWPAATQGDASLAADIADLKRQLAAQETTAGIDNQARQKLQDLQAEIANWKDQLTQATGNSGAVPQPIDLGPIEMRLAALEEKIGQLANATPSPNTSETAASNTTDTTGTGETQAPATPAVDVTALTTRLAELEGRLAGLGDAATRLDSLSSETATQKAEIETAKAKLENVAALNDRLTALESEAKTLGAGLSEMTQDNADIGLKRQRAAALVLALGQLRAGLTSDRPFSAELAAAEDLGRADPDIAAKLAPALDPLKPIADTGAPTLSQLQASLPTAAIAQAASADAAGAALGVDSGWLQKTLNRLSELVTVRPVGDVEGDGTLAHLARAEARLGAGDLAAAAAEVKGMSGQATDAAKDWLAQAEARLVLDTAAGHLASVSAEALVPAVQDPAAQDGAATPDQSN